MKLVHPSFEICEQGPDLEGIYEAIERAGRTCYKSKRPEGQTAKDFVDRMIASQHYAMLEHGTVYLCIIPTEYGMFVNTDEIKDIVDRYKNNPYSKVIEYPKQPGYAVTTNYRVLVENGWLNDLQYLCEPTEHHEKRVTVRFITDRGVSHEFIRHRVFSFAQESTRYCNYSKDKFGNELTFIIPSWYNKETDSAVKLKFLNYLTTNEGLYLDLLRGSYWAKKVIKGGATYEKFKNIKKVFASLTPQQARQVLPNALKTELVMTGFVSDWEHFFDLRARGTTGAPHPDAKALVEPLMCEFKKRDWL